MDPIASTTPGLDPPIDLDAIRAVVARARAAGRTTLLEPEGYEVLGAAGIAVPAWRFVTGAADPTTVDIADLAGSALVVKVVAPGIAHKTEAGGVRIVPREASAVADAIGMMRDHLGPDVAGYLIASRVEHDAGPGGELLAAVRWTDDFGPVVTIGIGGVDSEVLARHLRPDVRLATVCTATQREDLADRLRGAAAVELTTSSQRGQPARLPMGRLIDVVDRLLALGRASFPDELHELEINPLAITSDGLVALDVLATLGTGGRPARPARPIQGLARLLEPRSIAIVGVSSTMNPGRTILQNLLRDGFDPARVSVVKPGVERIDGCRCVPDLDALPERADLLVVAVSAADAPSIVRRAIETDAAASLIVIPGGLEEKEGTGALVAPMHAALEAARADGRGPLINGGNCLGIRSRPGRYDTMFIPTAKLAGPGGAAAPLAIVAQSGGFAISRLSRLRDLDPRYVITVGNQMDLTVGDYLTYLRDDPAVEVFGVYVEGFAPLDGLSFLHAARAITDAGRSVVFYRAGRTAAGATASASHTASIAGDADAARALAAGAGVVVADTLTEFDDLLAAFTRLRGRTPGGRRLAAITNAGFECVAVGDNLGPFELARFGEATHARIDAALGRRAIGGVVDIHDPLDLTPMAGEVAYEEVLRAVLDDPDVDLAVVGVVPLTVELQTLAAAAGHGEDAAATDAIAARLVRLWAQTRKPWVVVVDAGERYDPLCRLLEDGGIPTFRTVDTAMRTLARWSGAAAGPDPTRGS